MDSKLEGKDAQGDNATTEPRVSRKFLKIVPDIPRSTDSEGVDAANSGKNPSHKFINFFTALTEALEKNAADAMKP